MWDLKLNPETRDLASGFASGRGEVLQRLVTRLNRELGEWFLDTSAGIPWHPQYPGRTPAGYGILGGRDTRAMELLIRAETLGTDGVAAVVKYSALPGDGARDARVYMEVTLDDGFTAALSAEGTVRGMRWHME